MDCIFNTDIRSDKLKYPVGLRQVVKTMKGLGMRRAIDRDYGELKSAHPIFVFENTLA